MFHMQAFLLCQVPCFANKLFDYLIMHYVVDKYGIVALKSNEIAVGIYLTRIFGTILVATFITLILRKIKFPIKAY